MTLLPHLALLRLVSPALPVGAFSYSRGLEAAVAAGWVHDEHTAADWICDLLTDALCPLDGAVLLRLHRAFTGGDAEQVLHWTHVLRASRESAELLLEDEQMGLALSRLLLNLGVSAADLRARRLPPSYTCMFALAAVHWQIALEPALLGFFYAAAEGQVSAALRLLPLGQTAGQRMLERALPRIERCVAEAQRIPDDEIGNFSPGLALASAWHEHQYSRLFRS
jgi:urease accessory protein